MLCRWLSADPFARGERNGRGHDGWVATLDWVLHEDVGIRFLERVWQVRRDGDHPSLEAYPDRPARAPDPIEPALRSAPKPTSEPPSGRAPHQGSDGSQQDMPNIFGPEVVWGTKTVETRGVEYPTDADGVPVTGDPALDAHFRAEMQPLLAAFNPDGSWATAAGA